MEINDKKFNKVKQDAEEYYKNLENINCPYLQEDVYFI